MAIDLSIVVPTVNEAQNLCSLVPSIFQNVGRANLCSEVIVVDDQSTDGTAGVAHKMAKQFPVRVIERHRARGLSSAALEGMCDANGRVLLVMDADLSHPPEHIPALAHPILQGTADIAIGSRYVSGGSVSTDWPWIRRAKSRIATRLARPITSVRDPLTGFFAVSAPEFHDVIHRIHPSGFKILLELLSTNCFARVIEVPIHFQQRSAGRSKLTIATQFQYVRQLMRLYARYWDGKRYRSKRDHDI